MGHPAAILFDLDGTLVDSERAICDGVRSAFLELNVDVAAHDVAQHLGAPLDELYALYVGDDDDERRAHFVRAYIHHHDAHPNANGPLFPTVDDTIRHLHGALRIPLAVATTKPTHRARVHIDHHALDGVIRHVQGTDEGMRPKPHPDVIHAACRALKVSAKDVWMVGDTKRDVDAARAAGAHAVVIAWNDELRARAKGFAADAVISSMTELIDRLR